MIKHECIVLSILLAIMIPMAAFIHFGQQESELNEFLKNAPSSISNPGVVTDENFPWITTIPVKLKNSLVTKYMWSENSPVGYYEFVIIPEHTEMCITLKDNYKKCSAIDEGYNYGR